MKTAKMLADYLAREVNLSEEQRQVVAYGLEIILGGIIKTVFFIFIPLVMGVLPQVFIASGVAGVFRLPSGGAHCSAYLRCLIGSLVVFTTIGLVAKAMANYPMVAEKIGFIWLATLTLIVAVIGSVLWVPADTPIKPVKDPRKKRKAKYWAFTILALYGTVLLTMDVPPDILVAGSLGLLVQVFTISPHGYKYMNYLDKVLILISRPLAKERRSCDEAH